jgi:hypothetical protein
MDSFLISELFRLELHWESAEYNREGYCDLEGAYFCGPALSVAQEINSNDHLLLDFHSQYLVLIDNLYVGKLSWGEVIYEEDGKKVYLKDVVIYHPTELNKAPRLKNDDFIVIDTRGHEPENHMYNLLYKSYVINPDKEMYNFRI